MTKSDTIKRNSTKVQTIPVDLLGELTEKCFQLIFNQVKIQK